MDACDIKLKALLETIEIELRGLLADLAKKKHPTLKAKVELAVEWIKNNKNRPADQVDEDLTLLIDVFHSAVQQRYVKIYMQIFNMMQRLVMTLPGPHSKSETAIYKMSQNGRDRLLEVFCVVTDFSSPGSEIDEMTQIKVL